ncbi:MAG TPA: FadR/GntR family transcriptional regulator [Segeticoccus sp.]|uniref:FadR/GntR family transcriptional regulator n=1 Tax=Segeticoccus sp. TaxID=2706531 RepID=UPI002D7F9D3E|nr:FadR/GntR family transcriptional regulator [Segeticoccus sp.]HET8598829.1 FadR/GntR family transcriptional regulator [Segeticoccus sp.]
MEDSLRKLPRPRLYEQVVERLRAYVTSERLGAGDRLPGERDLAARLGVSRASVAQAIVALEVQGLVETRHGGGIFLLRDTLDPEPATELLARRDRLPDVLDAREALETQLARLAALRRTEEDLAAMEEAMRYMRRQVDAGELPLEGDRRFHASVVTAAHSALLAAFYDQIRDAIAESRQESLRQPHRPAQSFADHQAVADAIRAGDGARAAAAMHRHVEHVSSVRLLSWQPRDD